MGSVGEPSKLIPGSSRLPRDTTTTTGNRLRWVEFATGIQNSVGLEYRYTDTIFPNVFLPNGVRLQNYNEDLSFFSMRFPTRC
jgi:hypothetical protein